MEQSLIVLIVGCQEGGSRQHGIAFPFKFEINRCNRLVMDRNTVL